MLQNKFCKIIPDKPEDTDETTTTDSDSEREDFFPDGNDYLLDGLRAGMRTIRTHTRKCLADCRTDESCRDLIERLNLSTLKLMRDEKSYLQTSKICVDIIDDVCAELDEIEERESGGKGDGQNNNAEVATNGEARTPSLPSLEVVIMTREKMSKMFDERLKIFNETIDDEDLKGQSEYTSLQAEIELGRDDFEKKQSKMQKSANNKSEAVESDDEDVLKYAVQVLASRAGQPEIEYGEETHDDMQWN